MQTSKFSSNKKIAKNTLYMYFRMIVMLFISLYTTRIVFNALGVDNYGIYNLVGGVVVFFSFLNNGLSNATRRYITAEIAAGTDDSRNEVFGAAIVSHILISIILLLIAETIGLFLINNVLNIPSERMFAANVVYQLSVLTAIIGVMQSPFSSAIIAYEKMSIYAYITIFDVLVKLIVVFFLKVATCDKLILYGTLLVLAHLLTFFIFSIYSIRSFTMCSWSISKNKLLVRKMFNYTSWSLLGQASVVATNQGCSMLVNFFHDVAVNAAMGVSGWITKIVHDFVRNFQVAFNPQITKHYVSNEYKELNLLVYRTSRYSSFLVLIFLLPVCFEAGDLLRIWLGEYPQYSVEFCVLTMISIFLEAITAPLWMVLVSDVDIKKYQIIVSSIFLLNVLFSWIFLFLGFVPYIVMIIRSIINMVLILARLLLVEQKVPSFSKINWIKEVFLKSGLLIIIPLCLTYAISSIQIDLLFLRLLVVSGVAFMTTLVSIFFMGLTKEERLFVINKIKTKV